MKLNRSLSGTLGIAALLVLLTASSSQAAFTINLNFAGGLTTSQQAVFSNAKATWESLIPGYLPGITVTGINISASGETIDGAGGILGSAGPTAGVIQNGYTLATTGAMRFDSADLAALEANGTLQPVILHEMAHVMGFGTLWTNNNVYVNGTGRYTGVNGLAAYRFEFSQASATAVPVELDGGAGTANGHWDELTNVFNLQGRTLSAELMTGFLDTSNPYISQTTVQSFRDLGFAPVPLVVPEAGTMGLMALGITAVGFVQIRRRKK